MNEVVIRYSISPKLKLQAILVSVYLMIISLVIAIVEMSKSQYEVYFFIGIVGVLLSLSLLVSATISQPKPLVVLNNHNMILNFPAQRLKTIIEWEQVKHIGIGLSTIDLVLDDRTLNVDLELLKYHDLKILKSKLIEIAEGRNIPFNNI